MSAEPRRCCRRTSRCGPCSSSAAYRLQDAQVSFGIAADQCGIEGLLQTMPRDRQYVFVCQLLVQDDGVEPFVHDSNRAGAASSLLAAPDQIHHEIDVTCTGIFTAIAAADAVSCD